MGLWGACGGQAEVFWDLCVPSGSLFGRGLRARAVHDCMMCVM